MNIIDIEINKITEEINYINDMVSLLSDENHDKLEELIKKDVSIVSEIACIFFNVYRSRRSNHYLFSHEKIADNILKKLSSYNLDDKTKLECLVETFMTVRSSNRSEDLEKTKERFNNLDSIDLIAAIFTNNIGISEKTMIEFKKEIFKLILDSKNRKVDQAINEVFKTDFKIKESILTIRENFSRMVFVTLCKDYYEVRKNVPIYAMKLGLGQVYEVAKIEIPDVDELFDEMTDIYMKNNNEDAGVLDHGTDSSCYNNVTKNIYDFQTAFSLRKFYKAEMEKFEDVHEKIYNFYKDLDKRMGILIRNSIPTVITDNRQTYAIIKANDQAFNIEFLRAMNDITTEIIKNKTYDDQYTEEYTKKINKYCKKKYSNLFI